jgi:hypothetical protein
MDMQQTTQPAGNNGSLLRVSGATAHDVEQALYRVKALVVALEAVGEGENDRDRGTTLDALSEMALDELAGIERMLWPGKEATDSEDDSETE